MNEQELGWLAFIAWHRDHNPGLDEERYRTHYNAGSGASDCGRNHWVVSAAAVRDAVLTNAQAEAERGKGDIA